MLIIREIKTFISDNAYEPWKKAILAVPLQSVRQSDRIDQRPRRC